MNKKRPQAPKPRNRKWMEARLEHSNRNLTVPAGNGYKRKPKHANKGWD